MAKKNLQLLNEARVQRTIDPKLWASVSSGISKTYKNDLGASAKPIGTREQLLQRFVAALIILKQQCPMTEQDMLKCPAFNQWAVKLVEMGVTMADVHKLWNENCGNLPTVSIDAVPDDVSTDDLEDTPVKVPTPIENKKPVAPVEIDIDTNTNNDNTTISKEETAASNASENIEFYLIKPQDPVLTAENLHKLMFKKNSEYFDLHGCKDAEDAFKYLNGNDLRQELTQITNCENRDDMMNLARELNLIYALRVHGGNPEEVIGDVVWCGARTRCSYYVVIGNHQFKVYYKEDNGNLSLSFIAQRSELGLK